MLLKKVASYGGIITMFGSIIVSSLFPVLMARLATSAGGWTRLILVIMIPATLIGLLRFFLCKEDPNVEAGSNQEPIRLGELKTLFSKNKYVWYYALIMLSYNIITNLAVGSYYFKYVVGNTAQLGLLSVFGVVLLPLMLVFPVVMKKVGGLGKMLALFSLIGIVGYVICFFSGAFVPGVLAGYLLGTLATLPIAYYGILFVMNICNYNEMMGLQRMEASSSSLANFASKAGAALGAYVTGLVLSLGGYISTTSDVVVEQPASAIFMIRFDFALVPVILLVVILLCSLAFSKLEPKVEAYEKEKKERLAAEAAAKSETEAVAE